MFTVVHPILRSCLGLGALGLIATLHADASSEATPWTRSFLEARVDLSAQQYRASFNKDRWAHAHSFAYDGQISIGASPLEDWGVDLGIQEGEIKARKGFARIERQLYSDLKGDPLACTFVVGGSISSRYRSRQPVYFEMAQNAFETGFGVGRHLFIKKKFYTQLFAYVYGGVGNSRASWGRCEIGVQNVYARRHRVRLAYEGLRTFRSHGRFQGIGTRKIFANGCSALYGYTFDNGIELKCWYTYRRCIGDSLRWVSELRLAVSTPIEL